MPGRRVWRPRVLWTRRPVTQVVPDRREPTRQALRQAAREAADNADGPECPACGGPTVWHGACYRCLECGFKGACAQD